MLKLVVLNALVVILKTFIKSPLLDSIEKFINSRLFLFYNPSLLYLYKDTLYYCKLIHKLCPNMKEKISLNHLRILAYSSVSLNLIARYTIIIKTIHVKILYHILHPKRGFHHSIVSSNNLWEIQRCGVAEYA